MPYPKAFNIIFIKNEALRDFHAKMQCYLSHAISRHGKKSRLGLHAGWCRAADGDDRSNNAIDVDLSRLRSFREGNHARRRLRLVL